MTQTGYAIHAREVRQARQLHADGWSHREIAAYIGVGKSTVYRWVNGEARVEAGWPDGVSVRKHPAVRPEMARPTPVDGTAPGKGTGR